MRDRPRDPILGNVEQEGRQIGSFFYSVVSSTQKEACRKGWNSARDGGDNTGRGESAEKRELERHSR